MKALCFLFGVLLPILAYEEISIEALKNITGPEKVVVLYNITFACHRSDWCAMATVLRTIDSSIGDRVLNEIEIVPFECTTNSHEIHHQLVLELPRNGTEFNTFNETNLWIISDCNTHGKPYEDKLILNGPGAMEKFATFKQKFNMTLAKPYTANEHHRWAFLRSYGDKEVETFDRWANGEQIDRTIFMKTPIDAYWQKGCADSLKHAGFVRDMRVGQAILAPDSNRPSGAEVYIRGTMWCRGRMICAMIYYTFRYGPVCPYQAFSGLRCTPERIQMESKKKAWMDEQKLHITDVDGFNSSFAQYEIGIEVYHDCDNGRESENVIIKKAVYNLTTIDGSLTCYSIHWETDVTGQGTVDFNRDQADRYEFYHSNYDRTIEEWLNGTNAPKLHKYNFPEEVYKECS